MERVQPILSVNDTDVSRAFYLDIIGFKDADWGLTPLAASFGTELLFIFAVATGLPGPWVWVGFNGDIFELH